MKSLKKLSIYLVLFVFLAVTPATVFAGEKINLNTASVAELTQLKGVGEKTAQKIIAYRSEHKFKSVEELTEVKGIGKSTLAKFKDQVTVNTKN